MGPMLRSLLAVHGPRGGGGGPPGHAPPDPPMTKYEAWLKTIGLLRSSPLILFTFLGDENGGRLASICICACLWLCLANTVIVYPAAYPSKLLILAVKANLIGNGRGITVTGGCLHVGCHDFAP